MNWLRFFVVFFPTHFREQIMDDLTNLTAIANKIAADVATVKAADAAALAAANAQVTALTAQVADLTAQLAAGDNQAAVDAVTATLTGADTALIA